MWDFVPKRPQARRWKGRHSAFQGCYRGPSGGAGKVLVPPRPRIQVGDLRSRSRVRSRSCSSHRTDPLHSESESRRRVGSARLGACDNPGSENFGIRSVRGDAAPVVPSRYPALSVRAARPVRTATTRSASRPEQAQLPSASAGGADPVSSGASVSPDHLITTTYRFAL